MSTEQNWKALTQRLLAANQIGIRFDQDNGHRYFKEDYGSGTCFHLFGDGVSVKEYGAFEDALDRIDAKLAERKLPILLDIFEQMINQNKDFDVLFKTPQSD